MPNNPNLPSLAELDEFRTAAALARAAYAEDNGQVQLLAQLINDPQIHVSAMRSLIMCLLHELDGEKRSASDTLTFIIEQSAIVDANK